MHHLCLQAFLISIVTFVVIQSPFAAFASEKLKKPVDESIHIRQDTQQEEQKWRDEKEKLFLRLNRLEQVKQRLVEQKTELEAKATATRGRVAAKQKQLDDIKTIKNSITPLIDSQIEELQAFVAVDLPFLSDERTKRLHRLIELRDAPEVPESEKFRKVLEAMLVEVEYGNTIEVYQQTIDIDGRDILVNIFRLGRICIFYQTLDQKSCGFYNVSTASWQPLPAGHSRAIATAMEIGAKRRPVELLTLPLGRMKL